MAIYRSTFPTAFVPPKMHMLEDHAVEWVKQRNVGFGLLGEQGAESIHARFNNPGSNLRMPAKGRGTVEEHSEGAPDWD